MCRRLFSLFVFSLVPLLGDAYASHFNDAPHARHAKDVNAVLYASVDNVTHVSDIFASDPISGTTVNLTKGRVGREGGWSQPWEPVGNQHKVVFRQFRGTGGNVESRIFVLEAKGRGTVIHQNPELFAFATSFTWSNDNRSFAFVNQYASGSGTEVVIIEDEAVKARIPTAFSQCSAKWSPDGKWIAVTSRMGEGLLLISTDDYSQTEIPLAIQEGQLAWGSDGRRVALVLDGRLSITGLDGIVLQAFGEANAVNDWSADGKYISYYVRNASGERQLGMLFLGGSEEVDSVHADESGGMWSPDGTVLAFWAGDWEISWDSWLMVVGPDGENPRVIGHNYGGFMNPSWFKLPRGMLVGGGR